MKFNKGKCWILHLVHGNPVCTYRLGNERLDSSSAERNLGVLVHSKLSMSQQCALAAKRPTVPWVHQALHCSWSREGIVLFCSALVQPHLECCVQVWVPQCIKDKKLLESVQRRATKLVKGLEEKPYEEWLKSLGLFSLEKRRLRADLLVFYSFLTRGGGGTGLISSLW